MKKILEKIRLKFKSEEIPKATMHLTPDLPPKKELIYEYIEEQPEEFEEVGTAEPEREKKKLINQIPEPTPKEPQPVKKRKSKFRGKKSKEPKEIYNINSDQSIKPKKDTGRRILRFAFWIIPLFIFCRGVVDIIRPDPLEEYRQMTTAFIAEQEAKTNIDFEVSSFARDFAYEYLTYDAGGASGYTDRLEKYITGQQVFSNVQTLRESAKALYVGAYKVEEYNTGQYDVYVKAVVNYPVASGTFNNEVVIMDNIQQSYLKIPVQEVNGSYRIEDVPVYVAEPTNPTVKMTPFSGREADPQITKEITNALDSFFPAYYSEDQTRIDYFLHENAEKEDFKGLAGRFEYNDINTLSVFQDPTESSKYLAIAEINITDVNKHNVLQRFNLLFQKEKDRYYLVSWDTRTNGLKYDYSYE